MNTLVKRKSHFAQQFDDGLQAVVGDTGNKETGLSHSLSQMLLFVSEVVSDVVERDKMEWMADVTESRNFAQVRQSRVCAMCSMCVCVVHV